MLRKCKFDKGEEGIPLMLKGIKMLHPRISLVCSRNQNVAKRELLRRIGVVLLYPNIFLSNHISIYKS